MIEVTVSEARDGLADLLGRVQHGHENVTITRHGKPVAVIVSVEELALLERLEEEDDVREANKAWAEYAADPSKARRAEEVFADLLARPQAE